MFFNIKGAIIPNSIKPNNYFHELFTSYASSILFEKGKIISSIASVIIKSTIPTITSLMVGAWNHRQVYNLSSSNTTHLPLTLIAGSLFIAICGVAARIFVSTKISMSAENEFITLCTNRESLSKEEIAKTINSISAKEKISSLLRETPFLSLWATTAGPTLFRNISYPISQCICIGTLLMLEASSPYTSFRNKVKHKKVIESIFQRIKGEEFQNLDLAISYKLVKIYLSFKSDFMNIFPHQAMADAIIKNMKPEEIRRNFLTIINNIIPQERLFFGSTTHRLQLFLFAISDLDLKKDQESRSNLTHDGEVITELFINFGGLSDDESLKYIDQFVRIIEKEVEKDDFDINDIKLNDVSLREIDVLIALEKCKSLLSTFDTKGRSLINRIDEIINPIDLM